MMWKGHVPSPGFDSYLLSEGARVFNERCTPCHGDTGNGDGDLAEWTMP
jgi:cytochrome c